jgi:hypothetical protein
MARTVAARLHRDEAGQSLPIVLALVTFLFLVGGALALHASTALRATVANEDQADDLHAADAGAELGIWWHRAGNAGSPPAITINGRTVTTTVSIAGSSGCVRANAARLTGFEYGTVSAQGAGLFSSVTGTGATADTSVARNGSYSLRIADTALTTNNVAWSVSGGVVVARLGIRLASLPAADVTELLSVDAAAGNDLRLGYDAAAQRLTLRFGGAAAASASTAAVAGTWYRLDLRATLNTNPRTADWQLDGTAQTAASWAGAASTGSNVRLGSTVLADAYTANYDDILVSTTGGDYPIGEGKVVALLPDGMGTNSNPGDFRHDDNSVLDAATWQRLDEVPMSSLADFVRQRTTNTASYVELTVGNTAETCIAAISGVFDQDATGGGTDHGKTSVFDGATERVIYDGAMDVAVLTYRSAIVAPAAAPWSTASVNGLRIRFGFSNDANPDPHWHAFILELATGSVPPGTVTVSASAGASTVTTTYTDSGAAAPTLSTWTATR